jgi:hypothetical protein
MSAVATRDIMPGEEITLSCMEPLPPFHMRDLGASGIPANTASLTLRHPSRNADIPQD